MGILKDEMDAEDAVQDSVCNLLNSDLPVTSEEARFRLFAVLKNVCLNKLKRKRPIMGLESLEVPIEDSSGWEAESQRQEVLRRLSPVQREVFRLSLYEELEYEEIAERLGITIDAVRMNMCRARKILRAHYKKSEL